MILALWCIAPPLAAQTMSLSLQLPVTLLQSSLRQEFGLGADQPTQIFRQDDCRFIEVKSLDLQLQDQQVRLSMPVSLRYGPGWFDNCLAALDWTGTAEFDLEPYITEDDQLRYRLIDTRLRDADGATSMTGSLVWTLLKRVMQPRLEAFQVDLKPPRTELAEVIHTFIPYERGQEMDGILASARPLSLQVEQDRILIPLQFEIPDHYLSAPPTLGTTEAPLTPEELEQFATTAQAWDAFLVFIIKTLGLDTSDPAIRLRLAELLLDSRYQALAILAGEPPDGRQDPTRLLFLSAWNDLRALILEASQRGQVRGELLAYLTLLNAGDALFFLDHTAPGLGIEISVDGLRRLARALRPDDVDDPLRYDWAPDPFLQDLFELREPEPPAPTSWWLPWMDLLIASAWAADSSAGLQQLSERLEDWVPTNDELEAYRTVVATLLETVLAQETATAQLSTEEAKIVRHMVPATALIESCWRQYTRGQNGITHVRSVSGSVGLMQINPAVWRGIFDVERLKKDAGYNAQAGTRILLRYMKQYARPIAKETGNLEDIARASYAAYNAGPRAAKRFLAPNLKTSLRQIDTKFWDIYAGFADGGQPDLSSCRVVSPT